MQMRLLILLVLGLGFLSNCQHDYSTIAPSSNGKLAGDWQLTKRIGGLGGRTITPQVTSTLRFTTAGTYTRLFAGVVRETGRYEYTPIDKPKPNEKQATITLSSMVFYNSNGQQSGTSGQPAKYSVQTKTDSELAIYEDQVADGYTEYYARTK